MTMTVLPKSALPLSAAAAILLALSGCNTGSATSHAGGTPAATSQPPSPTASDATSQATASDGVTTTPEATSGTEHACALVTQQEATTALGTDPGPGQESTTGTVGNCVYGAASSVVRVSVDPVPGKAAYDNARSTVTSANPASVVDVPGVGDGAFETPSGASEATVYFYKGDTYVEITLGVAAATGPPKDQVIALATTAAGRV